MTIWQDHRTDRAMKRAVTIVGIVAGVIGVALGGASGEAFARGSALVGASVSAGRPLSQALSADGRLRHVSGSFDARGYRLVLGTGGAPRFVKVGSTRRTGVGTPGAATSRPAASSSAGAAASLAGAANPADAFWSDSFGNVGVAEAVTLSAVAISGSNIYIGGSFSTLSYDAGGQYNNVARWNGHGWYALGAGTNGAVNAIAVSGAKVYVGGSFTNAGGVPANAIASWNGLSWSALGAGVSDPTSGGTPAVNALAVSGTTLYVGGSFDNAGPVVAHSIAAWNGTSWSALDGGILDCNYFDTPNHCYSAPASGQVNALLVSGSTLYAGGSFNWVAAQHLYGLAAWNGSTWSGVGGSGVADNSGGGTVNALALGGTTLYVGGTFDHAGVTSTSGGGVSAASVASWNGSAWQALGSGANNCSGCGSATVDALAYWNGRLYMGGSFYGAGGDATPAIAQWSGTAWSPVGPGLDGGTSSGPTAIASSTAGVVAIGGFPTAGSGAVVLNHIGVWNGAQWTGYGLGLSLGLNSGSITAAAASNHQLYVGGFFTNAGWTNASNLAQFNGTSWSAVGGGVAGASAEPYAIAVYGREVFVGGSFTQAGTVAASNIAMWDGTSWHALGSGLDGAVLALLVYNGKLWVGGGFSHAGGGAASEVATWNLTTQTWAHVGGDANYDYGTVNALTGVTDPNNAANNHFVIIGGTFSSVDDGATPSPHYATVNGLLRFDTTAAITGPFSGYYTFPGTSAGSIGVTTNCSFPPCAGIVNALYADATKVYVGGDFDDTGSVASRGFALYDLTVAPPNGWSSPGVVGGGSGKGTVDAITMIGSSLYLTGDFGAAGPSLASDAAQYTPATHAWATLGSGLGTAGFCCSAGATLAPSADGLYVGGSFGLAGAKPSENLALWTRTAFGLKVGEVASPTSVTAESPVTYTATITNSTGASAAGVTLREVVPSTVQYVSATPSQGSCTKSGAVLTCSVGSLANGASATLAVKLTPIEPGTLTNTVTVSESGSTYTNTALASAAVTARPQTSYMAVWDAGFSPSSLTAPPGQAVQYDFFGPGPHSVKDGSPLALFDSGLYWPVRYYPFRYTAAGTYPVLDAKSTHTASVQIQDTVSAATVAHGSPVTIRMSSVTAATGFVLDLQVLPPGTTTWVNAQTGITTPTTTYTPTKAGTYQLRSRLRNAGTGAATAYSPAVSLKAT